MSERARSRNTRGLSVLVPLTILLLLVMMTTWLNRTIELSAPKPPRAVTHEPDYTVNNFTVVKLSDLGAPLYTLTAKELIHYPDDDTSHMVLPILRQTQPGKTELRVRADRALTTSDGEETRLYDNVEIFRAGDKRPGVKASEAQDLRITTSYLRVRPDDDYADTPAQVVIENGASTLIGKGMDFDNRYRKAHLHTDVHAKYIQPKKTKTN